MFKPCDRISLRYKAVQMQIKGFFFELQIATVIPIPYTTSSVSRRPLQLKMKPYNFLRQKSICRSSLTSAGEHIGSNVYQLLCDRMVSAPDRQLKGCVDPHSTSNRVYLVCPPYPAQIYSLRKQVHVQRIVVSSSSLMLSSDFLKQKTILNSKFVFKGHFNNSLRTFFITIIWLNQNTVTYMR